MSTTTTKGWTPSINDASDLWADGLAIASEIVQHGVHFVPFEIVRGGATGFALPEIRTKTSRGADAVYLSIAANGHWYLSDAVNHGHEGTYFPRTTHPRLIAEAVRGLHANFTA